MARNKKNLIARIQSWMDSVPGQMFMNYAYSWGAAIVILGTLFKLTYLPGANAMLFIGMGTEVFVFIISGFDRPGGLKESEEESEEAVGENDYDELSDEKEEQTVVSEQLQKDSEGQTVQQPVQPSAQQPVAATVAPQSVGANAQPIYADMGVAAGQGSVAPGAMSQGYVQSGPVIINGAVPVSGMTGNASTSEPIQPAQMQNGNVQETQTQQPAFDVKMLADMINASNAEFLKAARQSCVPEMEEAAAAYVEELKTLTETLSRVSLQAESLTRDSKEMDNLNRVLVGINSIYEVQLKSISAQIGTIDQINEQTRKMARQIEELNGIYSRMIKALTVNMKNAAGNASADQF